jgi:hypothetical protein
MSFMKNTTAAFAIALAGVLPATQADALVLDGGWDTFNWSGGVSASWVQTFSFTLTGSAILKVTDAFISGDMFDIFNFGVLLGSTSAVPAGLGLSIVDDYDAAFADGDWSSASFTLGPGSYEITGTVAQIATGFSSGGGALRLDTTVPSPVPIPAAGWMLVTALGGIAALRRRRKS